MDPIYYSSDIEEEEQKKKKDEITIEKSTQKAADHYAKLVKQSLLIDEYDKHERKAHMYHFLSMNAYSRHQKLMDDYLMYYGGRTTKFKPVKTDRDVIRENFQFVWDEDDDNLDWNKALAKRYYDKLFKEYCISDLVQYKLNRIALRWRTEPEVISGKGKKVGYSGQFLCGDKRCNIKDELKTWEVVFNYVENNVKKQTLVKLRLCPICSLKLNYCHKRREVTKPPKKVGKSKTQKFETKKPESVESQTDEPEKSIDWKPSVEKEKTQFFVSFTLSDEEIDDFLDDLFM